MIEFASFKIKKELDQALTRIELIYPANNNRKLNFFKILY